MESEGIGEEWEDVICEEWEGIGEEWEDVICDVRCGGSIRQSFEALWDLFFLICI